MAEFSTNTSDLFYRPVRKAWKRYFFAVALILVAAGFHYLLTRYDPEFPPFILFYPAVIVSAWYGGFWPGLTSTLLATGFISFYFVAPINILPVRSSKEVAYIILFVAISLVISSLMENLRTARYSSLRNESDLLKTRIKVGRLRKFVEMGRLGFIFGNPRNDRIADANDYFLEMTGYNKEDLSSGRVKWSNLSPEHYAKIDSEKYQECEKNAHCEPWEKEIIRKDGTRYPVLFGVTLLDDEWAAFVIDLSDQKFHERRRELELSVSQLLMTDPSTTDAIPHILQKICEVIGWEVGFFWDRIPNTETIRCTEIWSANLAKYSHLVEKTKQMAFSREIGLPGQAWDAEKSYWVADMNLEEGLIRRQAAFEDGLVSIFGFPILLKGDLLGVMEFFGEQIHRRDDELLRTMESIASEIGQYLERKQTEDDLRLSQMRFRLAIQAAKMGYWSLDLRTNEMTWSENLEFLYGSSMDSYPPTLEAFIGTIYHEDREAVRKTFEEAIHLKNECSLEFRSQWPDGSVHWISSRNQVFRDGLGNPSHMVGLGIEITDQKHSQQALKTAFDEMERRVQIRTAELAQANRNLLAEMLERQKVEREALEIIQKEQRRFSAQLHDGLCQNLAGIQMMATAISQKLSKKGAGEGDELRKVVELINNSVGEARDMARGLFPVELELNSLMFSLHGLASRMEQVFQVACRFHCPNPILIGDNVTATHLYRIAQEAVYNSIHHGNAKQIDISLLQDNNRIILKVMDNGQGLSQDLKVPKGIGLHIMKYRARMLDATLEFQSQTEGTLLTCSVPVQM